MNIQFGALRLLLAVGALSSAVASPGSAQEVIIRERAVPVYTTWQPAWDRFEFDHRHVILGTVTAFAPYRLQIARRNGDVQMIDLKNGTVILPTGLTPAPNERVAVIGYYSRGTFIANRVVLRQ